MLNGIMTKIIKPFIYTSIIIWGVYYAYITLLPQWPLILNWQLIDSDDITRTLEVRAWLDGQAFYDPMIHRSNPPFGGELHWSRLSDAPLALAQIFLRLFTDSQSAEYMAVFATPVLLGAIFTYCVSIAAKEILPGKYYLAFALLIMISFRALGVNFTPGRVDHHGLQLITFALFLMGTISNSKKSGIIAGIALTASLVIGFELLILQILCILWLVVEWAIYGQSCKDKIIAFSISLFISMIIGFVINVAPSHYFDAANERLSIAQLLPILVGAIGLGLVAYFASDKKTTTRLLLLALIAIPPIAILVQFPIMLKPLYWQVSPTLHKYWFDDIGEVLPLITLPINKQLILGAFPVLVLIASIIRIGFFIKSHEIDKAFKFSLPLGLLIITVSMTFFFQVRVSLQAAGVAIIIATALLSEAIVKPNIYKFIFAIILLNPLIPEGINYQYKAFIGKNPKPNNTANIAPKTTTYQRSPTYTGPPKCYSKPYYETLASLPKGLVANNISIGSYTLINTHHDVITIPFHRDFGRDYLFDMYLSDDAKAEKMLKQRGVNYIAYCSRAMEMVRIRQYSPNSFMAHVITGNAPNFLELIANKTPSDIIIYKVKY